MLTLVVHSCDPGVPWSTCDSVACDSVALRRFACDGVARHGVAKVGFDQGLPKEEDPGSDETPAAW